MRQLFLVDTGAKKCRCSCRCCLPPHLQHCSLRCLSSTRRFWQNFPKLLASVSCPALSSMVFATMSRRRGHPSQPWHAPWTRRNTLLLRPSLRGWRKPALSGGAIRLGPPPLTWCRNLRVLSAPVEIVADSTMRRFQTSTPSQTFRILPIMWPAPMCSPPSTL